MNHLGPAESLELQFGERLSVLTGDNGLGKSFVLEVAWWALTGTAINAAYDFMAGKLDKLRAPLTSAETIDSELHRVLRGDHPFLIRWRHHREKQIRP